MPSFVFLAALAFAAGELQTSTANVSAPEAGPSTQTGAPSPSVSYGRDGLDLTSVDGNFKAHVDWRAQFRYTAEDTLGAGGGSDGFAATRVRFKLGGHAYRPWLQYYLEYDFPTARLLDMRFTIEKGDALQVRVGRWKIPYNRERVDSSGNQQFADRSIVNDAFSVDRQQGALLFGHLGSGTRVDSWYNLGVFTGTGRNGGPDTDGTPMLLARWQWNVFGRDLPFSQSDVTYREKPAGSIAVAGVMNRSRFTAFSSEGGTQLEGFESENGRYDVRQAVVETAFQYHGFSYQQEIHWKHVEDRFGPAEVDLRGGYVQAGLFPHAAFSNLPMPLEVALRYGWVDPNTEIESDLRQEATLASSWFFYGHRNKVTLDFSWFEDHAAPPGFDRVRRLRMQWDVSF